MRPPAPRSRFLYVLLIGVVIVLGLATRRFRPLLTATVGGYIGDALWAVMVFFALAFLLPSATNRRLATGAALLALMVEVSQLYHAPWIDSIRHTTLGGLALGYDFDWRDLVCYAIGITFAAVLDVGLSRSQSFKQRAA